MATKTIIELEVKTGMRDELLKALEDMHEKRKDATGFLGFARYEVIDDPNKVVEITEWETAEARQAWLENSMALGILNRLIGLLATPFKAVTVRQIK